jgi:betaine lipid synthase
VILSRWVSKFIIGNEQFLWRALGVPTNQRDMIRNDHLKEKGSSGNEANDHAEAMWDYAVVENSLLGGDNYFYLLCQKGFYTKR